MTKYIERPKVIEACQFDGSSGMAVDIKGWLLGAHGCPQSNSGITRDIRDFAVGGFSRRMVKGDWVVKVNTDFKLLSNAQFKAKYAYEKPYVEAPTKRRKGKDFFEDFLGNEVRVGDTIIALTPKYRGLCVGTVVSISPKKCLVDRDPKKTGDWRKAPFHTEHRQVVKKGGLWASFWDS